MSETREDVPGEARETVSVELYKYHYLLYRDELLRAATAFEAAVKDALDRAAIPCHSVEARAKTHSSFTVKADRRIGERYKYADPLSEVKDCIAARVIVFTTEARSQAVSELGKAFTVSVVENPGERTCNGYDSDHLEISGLSADVRERYKDLDWFFTTWYEGARAEIQVRTVAGHAWAEYEHDVRYKPSGYLDLDATRRTKVDQLFIEAGGFRREIDRRFAEVDEIVRSSEADDASEPDDESPEVIAPPDGMPTEETATSWLEGFLKERYADGTNQTMVLEELERAASVLDALRINETALTKLLSDYSDADRSRVEQLMDYSVPPDMVRRFLDDLLFLLGEDVIRAAFHEDGNFGGTLELRSRRLNTKYRIYSVDGISDVSDKLRTAAGMLRLLTKYVAENCDPNDAVIEGFTGRNRETVGSPRVREVSTNVGPMWVNANLSREAAESAMIVLLSKIPGDSVSVKRNGAPIAQLGEGSYNP